MDSRHPLDQLQLQCDEIRAQYDQVAERLGRAEQLLRRAIERLEGAGPPEDEGGTAPRAGIAAVPGAADGAPPILVVDLYDSSRAALGELLRGSGYAVHEAGRAGDLAGETVHTPRLIVFDPGPFFDAALHTVARIRSKAAVPVVLLSATVSPERRERALAAGCAAMLPKPCAPGDLLSTINGVLSPAAARSTEPATLAVQPC